MDKKLAKITSAALDIKERGILSFWIQVDYEDGLSQGLGGIALDEYNTEKKERVGTAYGCEMIRRVLIALDVNDFSEMKGKHIWVLGIGDGFSFEPKGIQALKVDNEKNAAVIWANVANEYINK